MAANIRAASPTVRVIGPFDDIAFQAVWFGYRAIRSWVGLNPTTPHQAAGWRIDPARSLPPASGPRPAATAAAAPPLDPPAERSGAHGLAVAPNSRLSVNGLHPNSGVFVLPSKIAPAPRNRSATIASSSGTLCSNIFDPIVVRMPFVG